MRKKWGLALAAVVCLAGGACNKGGDVTSGPTGGGGRVVSGPDLATPKAAAMSFGKALENGDVASAKAASITTQQDAPILDAMVQMTGAIKKLNDAAITKYGEAGKTVAGSNAGGFDIGKQISESEIKESGDTATLTPKSASGNNQPLKLKRVNGQWKVDVSSMLAGQPQNNMAQVVPMFQSIAKAANETAGEIGAGKFASAAVAKQEFGKKMLTGVFGSIPQHQGMQPGGPPPGAPGAMGSPSGPGQ